MVQLVLMGMWQETGASREKKWTKSNLSEIVHTQKKKMHQAETLLENLCWSPQVHAQGTLEETWG